MVGGETKGWLQALHNRDFELADVDLEVIGDRFTSLAQEAESTLPGVAHDGENFAVYVAERLPQDLDVLVALEKMHIGDLYLAWACARGDRFGLHEFSKHFNGVVSGALMRLANQGVDVDDAKQRVLERLLLTTEDRNAAILNYGGQGRLQNFIRTCVVRESLKLLRGRKREPSAATDSGEKLLSLVEESHDIEFVALKKRYREDLRQALRDALEGLPVEERTMLRYHYVSGLSTRQIATIVGASFKTVARRLTRIRATLFERTRSLLMAKANLRKTEFHSIVRLVESQLDLSLERLLAPE